MRTRAFTLGLADVRCAAMQMIEIVNAKPNPCRRRFLDKPRLIRYTIGMRHSERKDRNALIDRGPQIRPFIGTRFFHAEYVTLKKALGPLSKAELARFYTEGSIDIPAGLAFDAVDEYITRVTLLRKMAKLRAWAFTDMQARREYRCYRRILAPFIPEERDVFEPGWRFWAALGLYANKGGKP